MKRFFPCVLLAAVGMTLAQPLFSQSPRLPRSTKEELQTLKVANQKVLEQQAATLLKLDEVQKDAGQLRIFVRRN